MQTNPTADQVNAGQTRPLQILMFSASLRRDSVNHKLISKAAEIVKTRGAQVEIAMMSDFDSPSYNQDLEQASGQPQGATLLREKLEACDAFIISSPEYNASIPGHLKNVIDWVSRTKPQPFNERHCMLMSASPSLMGGNRALWSLRIPLEHLGARVYPDMFSLASAHQAFSESGEFVNAGLAKRFDETLTAFLSLVEAARNYPCLKKAWVEFLGEHA